MDYKMRFATLDDHDLIYALKAESVRPYVEKIWGWDEDYQRHDLDYDFSHIEQFHVIEVDGSFAGFVQYDFVYPYFDVIEIHLLPEDRGKGISSDILRYLQKVCIAQDRKIRIGCFKENYQAKAIYQKPYHACMIRLFVLLTLASWYEVRKIPFVIRTVIGDDGSVFALQEEKNCNLCTTCL